MRMSKHINAESPSRDRPRSRNEGQDTMRQKD
jgi:hypothetical protein